MVGGHAALMRLRGSFRYAIYLLPIIFLALFYFYPLLAILDLGLRPDGWLDLSAFLRLFSTTYYIGTLLFTVYQATLSTALTLLLALPCAYVFSRYRFAGKSLLLSLATLPFVLPTVVVAMAFMSLIGKRGLVNDLLVTLFSLDYTPIQLERTLAIVIIVHVFYNFAIALRIMTSYWSSLGIAVEEAARVLGADEWSLWRDIRLPLIQPALLSAGALVFMFTFTSFRRCLDPGRHPFRNARGADLLPGGKHLQPADGCSALAIADCRHVRADGRIYAFAAQRASGAWQCQSSGQARQEPSRTIAGSGYRCVHVCLALHAASCAYGAFSVVQRSFRFEQLSSVS